MELYTEAVENRKAHIVLVIVQVILITITGIVFWNRFPGLGHTRRIILAVIIAMNTLTFIRFLFTLFVFIKRKIPWEEVVSVSVAFGLYYAGFFFLALNADHASGINLAIGVPLFLFGSLVNSVSELQRNRWKSDPQHNGKIYTGKLFGVCRHPNYLGDILWVSGYAVVSGSIWSFLIPSLLFVFFIFYNIPLQEEHMLLKYRDEYEEYQKKVKAIIPYIL